MDTTYNTSESNKWKMYFPDQKLENRKLTLTSEGKYSITKPKEARQIVDILARYVKPKLTTIIDGTAGCGGDTLNFALEFDKVISVELNATNCDCLKTNVDAYKLSNKISITCPTSFMDALNTYQYDMVFLDPPWGGKDYKKDKALDLYMCQSRDTADECSGKVLMQDLVKKLSNKFFAMKVPNNFNYERFKKDLVGRNVHRYPIMKYDYRATTDKSDVVTKKLNTVSFFLIVVEPAKPQRNSNKSGGFYYKYLKYKSKYIHLSRSLNSPITLI